MSNEYSILLCIFLFALEKPNISESSFSSLSSVTRSYLILYYPMKCSTPGLPVHHQLRSSHKPMSIEWVMASNHLIFCCPLLLRHSIFPSISVFQMSQVFVSGSQIIGVSASLSVLPMNTRD